MSKLVDKRQGVKILCPHPLFIPDGVQNTLIDIGGDAEGNVEVGTDQFIDAVIITPQNTLKLKYYPYSDKAYVWVVKK